MAGISEGGWPGAGLSVGQESFGSGSQIQTINSMILRTQAYQVADKIFNTLAEAQTHEIAALLDAVPIEGIPAAIVNNADPILDILMTGPRSKPKARKINGARKKHGVKPVEQT